MLVGEITNDNSFEFSLNFTVIFAICPTKVFLFFMESIKSFGQNYDEIVKKTFVDYYFWSDKKP